MTLEIRQLQANDPSQEAAWDRFVRSSPDGTVFHLTTWRRVVETVFRMIPHYLFATEGDEIRGVLPVFEVRGLLSGHVLISVPYGVYGGLCGSDPEARKALLESVRQLALRRRAKHIELRHLYDQEPGLPVKALYATFAKPIAADPDANLKAIPRKQRAEVRQGMKSGLEACRGWEPLAEFYEVYAANRRRLGSPPFPRRLFEAVRDHFGKEAQLLTIWHQGRMLSGVISLFYQDQVMPYYGAALEEGFAVAVNDFMYWELMRESCLAGYKVFDFGRSREGTGPYNFKRHWGFEPKPLAYQYMLVNGQDIPNFSPSNPRLRLFIESWKRLPLPVTKWLGPPLTRWLPLD
jgi:FemAB-related protein (PEP-CTERM system-associated)